MAANPSLPVPTTIERLAERRLRICWSDGQTREYRASELRDACPCATCREKHGPAPEPEPTLLAVIPLEETQPVDIAGMRPAGAYAYAIRFTDGHANGLFTFDLLRSLGEEATNG